MFPASLAHGAQPSVPQKPIFFVPAIEQAMEWQLSLSAGVGRRHLRRWPGGSVLIENRGGGLSVEPGGVEGAWGGVFCGGGGGFNIFTRGQNAHL